MKIKLSDYFLALVAFTFVLTGCSNNSDELASVTSKASQTNSTPKFKVRGDNKYDVLGFAFDATGPYLDQLRTVLPVIDAKKLDSVGLIISDEPVHSELDIKSGTDLKTLLTKYTSKFTLDGAVPTGSVPFTAGLSAEFSVTNTVTSKYSYAVADMNVYILHHAIKKFTAIQTLQNYLTQTFKNDLITKTPEQIIALYGTHVYTDIYTGGKMSFKYRAYVNNSTKESSATYGAKASVGKVTDANLVLSSTTTSTTTATTDFQQEFMSYSTIGGTGASPMGTWTPGSTVSINFNQWSSTVSKTNAGSLQLIDVGDNSLMAIYELVADPVKKAALKTAVDNYILSKKINVLPVIPLYRFSNSNQNHFYTINRSEVGGGWNYEGIQAFIFKNQEANTVPLYRFFKSIKKSTGLFSSTTYNDHYYTIVPSSANGYTNEGIIGYVYTTDVNCPVTVVGLRQYYRSSIYDHFYTTSETELGSGALGWSYNCDCCYVVDGTR